jgi:hypothetical protein
MYWAASFREERFYMLNEIPNPAIEVAYHVESKI